MFRSEGACPSGRESRLLRATKGTARLHGFLPVQLAAHGFVSTAGRGRFCLEPMYPVFASTEFKEKITENYIQSISPVIHDLYSRTFTYINTCKPSENVSYS